MKFIVKAISILIYSTGIKLSFAQRITHPVSFSCSLKMDGLLSARPQGILRLALILVTDCLVYFLLPLVVECSFQGNNFINYS